ncbi:hypothetical protein [Bacteroides reticulotermitis]|uniref:hypothetical protein n=1 Tax=Bacteroides reticulotermitis TaxID=1133319 RepID=UPI003A85ED55
MSEIVKNQILGITTSSNYEDGSTYSLVNLRPINGALQPVAPRKVEQELSLKYDIVFVHQNNAYKNWIGVSNYEGHASVYWEIRETPKVIASIENERINSIQQIGNTLSLITENTIYYLFYQKGKYIYLGEIPQVPIINLKTSDEMGSIKHHFISEYGAGSVRPESFIDATKGLVNKAIDIYINGGKDKNGDPMGGYGPHLFDACFIRYAFRLYDGTLTKHSPPILIMPGRPIVGSSREQNNSIKEIIYRFDGTLRDDAAVTVYGYKIYMGYDFSDEKLTKWKDIIKSVDIFMSAPLGISNIENIRQDMPTSNSRDNRMFNLIKGISPEALKNVSNTSNFYLVRSIELGTISTFLNSETVDRIPSNGADVVKSENLIYQEVMSDDHFSNHKQGTRCSYTYNSRLHLGGIKTTFFKGFNPDYFLWYNTANVSSPNGNYNGRMYKDVSGNPYQNLMIEVEINSGETLGKVYSLHSAPALWPIYKLFMSGFISYPDPRARRITIYRYSGGSWYKVFSAPLEEHNLLNLAFYIDPRLAPITEDGNVEKLKELPKPVSVILFEPNKIKVSELNNPLIFPNTNVYQVGNGEVLAMATNAMNVSDRNYGQHPLYVFTSQGIWTLNVGSGEVIYSTVSAPTYAGIPSSRIVGETPYGVVFATLRGLMIINGQNVEFISPQLEQPPLDLNIETNKACEGVVILPTQKKFANLLKDLSSLIYNPYEDELIIVIKDAELNYVLNISNRQFYQSTERIDSVVVNAFPELFIVGDNQLQNYADSETASTHVSLILRPLQFGSPYIKRLERMNLRGIFYNIKNPSTGKFSMAITYCSNDSVNLRALRGLPLREGNMRDKDMGLFGTSKFRSFSFLFAGVIDDSSQIYFLESIINAEYAGTKMR